MKLSDYKAAFIPMHLVFLELDAQHRRLNFKLLHENKNTVILKTFHLQLLSKNYEYIK